MIGAILKLSECFDAKEAGNKAVNLGALLRAGFRTPQGYVITSSGFERQDTLEQAVEAWRKMGSVPVAVRSSSAAEDAGGQSLAGQHDTILNVTTESALRDAIEQCRLSAFNTRTQAYLQRQGLSQTGVRMAVIVQSMAKADKAGVLFTADPRSGDAQVMVIEAARGLGDAVVSGSVTPDELRIERSTGRVLSARVGLNGAEGSGCCLTSEEVHQLWILGRRVAEHFGAEQDIEFAIVEGEAIPLQSRPITTLPSRQKDEKQELLSLLEQGRGPWAAHNLGETLENPTPLTWSVMRRFMTGDGGYGTMLKLAGFEPSKRVCSEGFLKLISGRIYMDLSVAGEMFFPDCPFEYDLEAVKRDPGAGQNPPTKPKGSFRHRAAFSHRLSEAHARMTSLSKDFDVRLKNETLPQFVEYCAQEKQKSLSALSNAELAELWRSRCAKTLDEFAPQSLMPGLIGAMAMERLRLLLQEWVWDESALKLAMELSVSKDMDQTLLAGAGLHAVGVGEMTLEAWLKDHGHRGPREMELASPRWRECQGDVIAMARALETNPADRHRHRVEQTEQTLCRILGNLPSRAKAKIISAVELARRYLVFRETGKHYLMLGFDLLRDAALEAGKRLGIGEGIFFLEQDEMLESLEVGFAPIDLVQKRMAGWKCNISIQPLRVIDREALETPGADLADRNAQATALSAGVAKGEVFVAHNLDDARGMKKGNILVCPKTDPAWTPLFAIASGLVIEQGGVLSHGAIVAREMNIPAIVLPGAMSRFKTGDHIVVDGNRGTVAAESDQPAESPADDAISPSDIPPVSGERERFWNRLSLVVAAIWGVFLLFFYWGGETYVRNPAMRLMDFVLWPLVKSFGKPAAVAIIAVASAVLVIVVQRLFTDNRRLLECKYRVKKLEKAAKLLPADSPKKTQLLNLTVAPTVRIVLASFVPLGLLLGPLMTTFTWLQSRMDGANWNMVPGKAVEIVAKINPDATQRFSISVPPPLALTADCPAGQSILPIKAYLERQLQTWRQEKSADPWMDPIRQQTLTDLESFLKDPGVPPQEIRWSVETASAGVGVYGVTVNSEDGKSRTVDLVLGDAAPPALASKPAANNPIVDLTVVYPRENHEFFMPLKKAGFSWDIGWLGLYLLAYLPAMALTRPIVRPA